MKRNGSAGAQGISRWHVCVRSMYVFWLSYQFLPSTHHSLCPKREIEIEMEKERKREREIRLVEVVVATCSTVGKLRSLTTCAKCTEFATVIGLILALEEKLDILRCTLQRPPAAHVSTQKLGCPTKFDSHICRTNPRAL